MNVPRQLIEVLSWRLATEFWRRFPDRYFLIETHPCSGQYDCLSLVEIRDGSGSALDVNREGSVHVHHGLAPQSWQDWAERILDDPRRFLDTIGEAVGIAAPNKLPKSTPTTISFRYVSELLTHTVGRLENWECRNGFLDTSGYGGGKRETWFNCFAGIEAEQPPQGLGDGRLDTAYCYWFFLKNSEPVLCVDTDGRLYTLEGDVHDLVASYSKRKRMWPVIAETSLDLLP